MIYNYFLKINKVMYGSWDYEWDMFSHKEEYLKFFKRRIYFHNRKKELIVLK